MSNVVGTLLQTSLAGAVPPPPASPGPTAAAAAVAAVAAVTIAPIGRRNVSRHSRGFPTDLSNLYGLDSDPDFRLRQGGGGETSGRRLADRTKQARQSRGKSTTTRLDARDACDGAGILSKKQEKIKDVHTVPALETGLCGDLWVYGCSPLPLQICYSVHASHRAETDLKFGRFHHPCAALHPTPTTGYRKAVVLPSSCTAAVGALFETARLPQKTK